MRHQAESFVANGVTKANYAFEKDILYKDSRVPKGHHCDSLRTGTHDVRLNAVRFPE